MQLWAWLHILSSTSPLLEVSSDFSYSDSTLAGPLTNLQRAPQQMTTSLFSLLFIIIVVFSFSSAFLHSGHWFLTGVPVGQPWPKHVLVMAATSRCVLTVPIHIINHVMDRPTIWSWRKGHWRNEETEEQWTQEKKLNLIVIGKMNIWCYQVWVRIRSWTHRGACPSSAAWTDPVPQCPISHILGTPASFPYFQGEGGCFEISPSHP